MRTDDFPAEKWNQQKINAHTKCYNHGREQDKV